MRNLVSLLLAAAKSLTEAADVIDGIQVQGADVDKPIDSIRRVMSVRAYKTLLRLGVKTMRELSQKTSDEVLSVRNAGTTTLNELESLLKNNGLAFRSDKCREVLSPGQN